MKIESAYPVIVTDGIGACRDFYVRHFGFEVVFESSWFIYLAAAGNPALGIAFMSSDHPSQPPGPEKFNGQGMFFTLQVAAVYPLTLIYALVCPVGTVNVHVSDAPERYGRQLYEAVVGAVKRLEYRERWLIKASLRARTKQVVPGGENHKDAVNERPRYKQQQ